MCEEKTETKDVCLKINMLSNNGKKSSLVLLMSQSCIFLQKRDVEI